MTFIELVNKVLIRLREPEVTSVSAAKYAKLIGAFVNDAKNAVEDAAEWVSLIQTINVSSVAGTADYALASTSDRTTIFSVVDDAGYYELSRARAPDLITKKQKETSGNEPREWAVIGHDNDGNLKIRLSPTPVAVRTYSVNTYNATGELVEGSDSISVPSEPVYLRALAMAIKERGEDQGVSYSEAMDHYRRALSRYLVLNNHSKGGSAQWRVL